MQIHELKLKAPKKSRKTIGRGGKKGTYSGRGNKGQKARSGGNVNPLFEGGRSTLVDHMKKKRGFKSLSAKKNVINLSDIDRKFPEGGEVSADSLIKVGLISNRKAADGIKILGQGEIKAKVTVASGILASASAKEKIEKAGGRIEAPAETKDSKE